MLFRSGTNALIQAGAKLVQSPDEIVMEMRELLRGCLREVFDADAQPDADTATPRGGATAQVVAALSAEEQAIVDMIRHEPQYFDNLAARLDPEKVSVQRLSAILLTLELKQVIRQLPGRLYTISQI